MTWVNLDLDWGLPAVNICVAGSLLHKVPGIEIFRDLSGDDASCERIQRWLAQVFTGKYGGAQLACLQWKSDRDMLVFTVVHPLFPRTKVYDRLPCWAVHVHETETTTPRFTLEELGA